MARDLARRLAAIEAALAGAVRADKDDFWSAMPKVLTWNELEAGQEILSRFGDDCDAALEARDPGWIALCAAAQARMAGIKVGELFAERRTTL